MTTDADNQKLLIALFKEGSVQAFGRIYDMYAKRLLAFCCHYAASREDAEEIVEDVFVRLWNSRESVRETESLHSLLFTISRRLVINAWRRSVNAPVFEESLDTCPDMATEAQALRDMNYEEFRCMVMGYLNKLTRTQRQVVILSRLDGYNNSEIASMLSMNEKTVKNQLSLGMKRLRQLMGHMYMLVFLLIYG